MTVCSFIGHKGLFRSDNGYIIFTILEGAWELALFLLSVLYAVLHFRRAGFSPGYKFNAAHSIFTSWFFIGRCTMLFTKKRFNEVIENKGLDDDSDDDDDHYGTFGGSKCNILMPLFYGYNIFYLMSSYLFYEYWEAVYNNKKNRQVRARKDSSPTS